jgi:hypothetical protein
MDRFLSASLFRNFDKMKGVRSSLLLYMIRLVPSSVRILRITRYIVVERIATGFSAAY